MNWTLEVIFSYDFSDFSNIDSDCVLTFVFLNGNISLVPCGESRFGELRGSVGTGRRARLRIL